MLDIPFLPEPWSYAAVLYYLYGWRYMTAVHADQWAFNSRPEVGDYVAGGFGALVTAPFIAVISLGQRIGNRSDRDLGEVLFPHPDLKVSLLERWSKRRQAKLHTKEKELREREEHIRSLERAAGIHAD